MPDVKGKADALTQQELAGQNFLARRLWELFGDRFDAGVDVLGLGAEEDARLEHLGGRVGHDAVGEVEAAQEDGGGGAGFGRQAAELGGAQRLDRVVPQELLLLGRGQELGQRGGRGRAGGREEVVGDIGGRGGGADSGDRGVGSRGVGGGGGGGGGGRRDGGEALGDGFSGEAVGSGARVGELGGREGPLAELGGCAVPLVFGGHDGR